MQSTHPGDLLRYSDEQPFRTAKHRPGRDIFDLATHKVYPDAMSPQHPVGSYPTFSPLLACQSRRQRLFSVALAVSPVARESFPLGSMVLCVVPTFLPGFTRGDKADWPARCKGTTIQLQMLIIC